MTSPEFLRDPDRAVAVARMLLLIDGLIWLGLAVNTVARATTATSSMYWVLAALMLGNAVVLAGIGLLLRRNRPLPYYLGLAVLIVNVVLTFTDQFGVMDLLTLLLDMAALVLLLVTHAHYLSREFET